MIEHIHRGAHWRSTKNNVLIVIGVLAALLLTMSLFIGFFAGLRFLGFPLQFYLVAQGGLILMIILMFWSSSRQDQIDRRHGAAEEL